MNRDDRLDGPGVPGQQPFQRWDIHIERSLIDINEGRSCPGERDRFERCDKGERCCHDNVTASDIQPPQRRMERVRSGTHGDTMPDLMRACKGSLEVGNCLPENKLGIGNDILDCGIDLRFDVKVLLVKISERNVHQEIEK